MKTKLIALFVSIMLVLVLSACGAAATPTAAPADGGDTSGGDATAAPAGDATAAPAGDVVAAFDFNNSGAVDICELYLSPVGTDSWGPDQLKGQKIAAGGKFTLTNIPANSYDAKWVGCDKTEGTLQVDIKNP
jgi:hypothetical protein